MTDAFIQFALSNLLLSAVIATVAYGVHRTGRYPMVAHLLWILVLVKVVTPPLFTVPVIPFPGLGESQPVPTVPVVEFTTAAPLVTGEGLALGGSGLTRAGWTRVAKSVLLVTWFAGSALILPWSLLRIRKFNRLLMQASSAASPGLQCVARDISAHLGLRRAPTIYTTAAHITPMVWWIGGRVRIVIPETLPGALEATDVRWVLAHELAHVRRRDHYVRWLEWLACVVFWWNPVAWWARRNLRINEEICCDALVLTSLQPQPQTYANALMAVVEFLSTPVVRPPAVASEMNSGGILERRLRMIISNRKITRTPRWFMAGTLLLAATTMPLGVAYAQDFAAIERRLGAGVAEGELTLEQAVAMMHALRKESKHSAGDRSDLDRIRAAAEETQRALESGRISPEDARRRQAEIRRAMVERDAARVRAPKLPTARDDMSRAREELKRAAEAGAMSKEHAERRLEELRKVEREHDLERRAIERRVSREEYANHLADLKRMIESGRITEEDGKRRLEEIRKKLGDEGERRREAAPRATREQEEIRRSRYLELESRLKRSVEAGEMSGAEAEKKLMDLKERIWGEEASDEARLPDRTGTRPIRGSEEPARRAPMERRSMRGESEPRPDRAPEPRRAREAPAPRERVETRRSSDEKVEWEAIVKRVKEAVNRGDMTPEEAAEMMDVMKRRMDEERKKAAKEDGAVVAPKPRREGAAGDR